MADKISKEKRSEIMSKIRKSETKPELILKKRLQGAYFRYQPKIYGNPDFALKSKKVVIFVDGCFWHKCPKCFRKPKSNKKYWNPKIDKNVQRDRKYDNYYLERGWNVIRVWEHDVMKNINSVSKRIFSSL